MIKIIHTRRRLTLFCTRSMLSSVAEENKRDSRDEEFKGTAQTLLETLWVVGFYNPK